ncbi:MAG TPA: PIG-L deacetylase family protein [Myxococcota bacterium]|nr:PIG-L deacetylase family protein [Myxococcota bacterium]
MAPADLPFRPERVLAIGAHPDDVEFGAGGTLGRLSELGARIAVVVCTDGGRGGRGLADAAAVRRAEQERAAKVLGIEDVTMLAHPDGALAPDTRLVGELVRAVRRTRPELVLAHDPRTWWQPFGRVVHPGHSDHRAAGAATLDALYPRAASPNFYAEQLAEDGLAPWYPRELWLFDAAEPDLVVDVAASFERKLEALRAHASQEGAAGGLVAAAQAAAALRGAPGRPGEAFQRLRLL